jgi:large subunit ribosomal protein L4
LQGKAEGDISLSEAIFGASLRPDIVQRVVRWQLAKRQAGTHKTKQVSEVTGGNKKPYKQKGTGSARLGNRKSTQQRGGGIAFGPVVRSHAHSLPKKIRALGLRSALSAKMAEGKVLVVKTLDLPEPKTKPLVSFVESQKFYSALFVGGAQVNANFVKASSNIPRIDVLPVMGLNVYDILRHDNLVISEDALTLLQERLA